MKGPPVTAPSQRPRTRPAPMASALAAMLALALVGPPPAAAQGTWLQTQCLAGAGTQTACKAPPAWGQTGTDYVQALATAAGPGNLGLSLVKPESLPAANAARAQLAAVMLDYLDARRPLVAYRWYGPVATAATGPRAAGAAAQPAATAAGRQAAQNASAPLPAAAAALPATRSTTAGPPTGSPPAAAASIQSTWLGGALGDEPLALGVSWWLAPSFFGATVPAQVDANADRYRLIRFLADHCPQLEGRVAPNAWPLCTR